MSSFLPPGVPPRGGRQELRPSIPSPTSLPGDNRLPISPPPLTEDSGVITPIIRDTPSPGQAIRRVVPPDDMRTPPPENRLPHPDDQDLKPRTVAASTTPRGKPGADGDKPPGGPPNAKGDEDVAAKPIRTYGELRTVPLDAFRGMSTQYHQDMDIYTSAVDHPAVYTYSAGTAPPTDADRVVVHPLLAMCYGRGREETRLATIDSMHTTGMRAINPPASPVEDVVTTTRTLLQGTATLANNLATIESARAVPPPEANQLTGAQKFNVKLAFDEINRDQRKPELLDYMRNNGLPRFTWEPIPLPDTASSTEYTPRLREIWRGYTSSDAHFLINPDRLAEGHLPFNLALTAARTAETEGQSEVGYAIKTAAINNILSMETSSFEGRFAEGRYLQIPFFTYIFAGAMTGDVGQIRNTHFNYEQAVTEVMGQTWERLAQEQTQGQTGPATEFLQSLNSTYQSKENTPIELAPYLARSLLFHARQSNIDVAQILRGLRDLDAPFAQQVIDHVLEEPRRRLLTNQELNTFVSETLPDIELPSVSPDQMTRASNSLIGTNDMYSFRVSLADVTTVASGVNASITVDISSGEADAVIRYKTNGTTRSIPVSVNLQDGSVTLATIDRNSPDAQTVASYRGLVEKAILNEKAKNDQALEEQEKARERGASQASAKAPTSEARQQPTRRGPKIKTKGVPSEQSAEAEFTEITDEPSRGRVTVIGLEPEKIAQMLKAQHISEIDPGTIIQKLTYLIDKAQSSNTSFGQRAPLEGIKNADRVKLRELKWITGGGHRQLRIYFREEAEGRLSFCGINDKKGEAQHHNYLQKLVDQLVRQRGR